MNFLGARAQRGARIRWCATRGKVTFMNYIFYYLWWCRYKLFSDWFPRRSGEGDRWILEFPRRNRPEREETIDQFSTRVCASDRWSLTSTSVASLSIGLSRSDVIDSTSSSSFIKFINVEFCGAIFRFASFMSENSMGESWKGERAHGTHKKLLPSY